MSTAIPLRERDPRSRRRRGAQIAMLDWYRVEPQQQRSYTTWDAILIPRGPCDLGGHDATNLPHSSQTQNSAVLHRFPHAGVSSQARNCGCQW